MGLECSIAVPNQYGDAVRGVCSAVHDYQVHLPIFVPVHRGYINGRRPRGKINVRTEGAVTIVDQNGDRIGAVIDCSEIRNVVAIKISHNKLGRSRTDWITLRGKTLARTGERQKQTKRGSDEALHGNSNLGKRLMCWDVLISKQGCC